MAAIPAAHDDDAAAHAAATAALHRALERRTDIGARKAKALRELWRAGRMSDGLYWDLVDGSGSSGSNRWHVGARFAVSALAASDPRLRGADIRLVTAFLWRFRPGELLAGLAGVGREVGLDRHQVSLAARRLRPWGYLARVAARDRAIGWLSPLLERHLPAERRIRTAEQLQLPPVPVTAPPAVERYLERLRRAG